MFAAYPGEALMTDRPDCQILLGAPALQRLAELVTSCQASLVDTGIHEHFLAILAKTCSRLCSDPRDRIFAVLAISDLHYRREVEPYYTIYALEVFRTVALLYVANTELLYHPPRYCWRLLGSRAITEFVRTVMVGHLGSRTCTLSLRDSRRY